MTAKSTDDGGEPHGGASRCRPPFPIFPIVCPLMFPVGFMIVMGRMRKGRRRAIDSRFADIEERLDDLEEKVSSD